MTLQVDWAALREVRTVLYWYRNFSSYFPAYVLVTRASFFHLRVILDLIRTGTPPVCLAIGSFLSTNTRPQ